MIRLLLVAFLTVASIPTRSSATPLVTPAGAVEGTGDGVVVAYKGIPYAAPPIGKLRWREPQPLPPWSSVRRAETFAPACMQTGRSMPGEATPTVSEDCLYLNVWAPKHARRLPVIVWIYGGGFTNGSASMPLYWGDRLARRGVIVVTFGYRLGPLGFLAHPALTAQSRTHTSGNYGLLDQIAALRWVKANIAAFGGDPSRVTIAGQSAGAISVSMLMASPMAKHLFARAIAQSGGLFEPTELAPSYKLAQAERDGEAYAKSIGARSLADLRALPATALLGGLADSVSHPVLDPIVLPRSPYEAYVANTQNDVPILIGSNEDEARSLVPNLSAIRAASFEEDITKSWGELPPSLLSAYPHATDAQAVNARLGFERDLRFGWDMWAWARLQARHSTFPVYYYHFDARPPFPDKSVYAHWGASHFAELWYMFDHLGQKHWAWSEEDRQLSDTMVRYWVNFARGGDPNGNGLPSWPQFTKAKSTTQYLGSRIYSGAPAHLDTLSVFDATYAHVRDRPFDAPSAP